MELKDTIRLMSSEDYKERFAAEWICGRSAVAVSGRAVPTHPVLQFHL